MNKFTSISIRQATSDDKHLPVFDNTKLVSLDTCTRYGILVYQMHKSLETKKAQALEAGTVLHEVFAAVRLWQLAFYNINDSDCRSSILNNHGKRLYKSRWEQLSSYFNINDRDNLIGLCLTVIHTSDYEEDPDDKKRSMSALEEVAINYINRWDMEKYPIWIRDKNDPNTDVGIEIGYDCVITFHQAIGHLHGITESFRFTGKLDGLHIDPDAPNPDGSLGNIFVVDNKTTARISEDSSKYDMDTQTRGYIIAARSFTGNDQINHAKIIMSALPVPNKSPNGGQYTYPIYHEEHQFPRWFDWFYSITQTESKFKDDPINAPVSPHSCFRYFRNCSMIPFCTASDEEQLETLETMPTVVWDVLADD